MLIPPLQRGENMAGNVDSGCCQKCGAHMLGRHHPVIFTVDGFITKRNIVCVGCRDELQQAVDMLWDTWLKMRPIRESQNV